MGTKMNTNQSKTQITSPRLAGEILHNYLENSNEPLAVAYREQSAEAEGWKRNTDLCMDVKTFLRSDRIAELGKEYKGFMKRDGESHYCFIEMADAKEHKRNPHVFTGETLNVTRHSDGSYSLNLKKVKISNGFALVEYADTVRAEIISSLKGLVEEDVLGE